MENDLGLPTSSLLYEMYLILGISFLFFLQRVLVLAIADPRALPFSATSPNTKPYSVYAAWGRSKQKLTNGNGEKFDNCGVWVATDQAKQNGVFLRANLDNFSFTEVALAPVKRGGIFLGSIDQDKWERARAVALGMHLQKPWAGYGWPWCVRSAVGLRWEWRRQELLYYDNSARSAISGIAVGGVVASGAVAVAGITRPLWKAGLRPPSRAPSEPLFRPPSPQRLEIELPELARPRNGDWSIKANVHADQQHQQSPGGSPPSSPRHSLSRGDTAHPQGTPKDSPRHAEHDGAGTSGAFSADGRTHSSSHDSDHDHETQPLLRQQSS